MKLDLGGAVRCPHCNELGVVGQVVIHDDPRRSQDRVVLACLDRDEHRQPRYDGTGAPQTVNHNVSLSDLARLNALSDE